MLHRSSFRNVCLGLILAGVAGASPLHAAEPSREELLQRLRQVRATLADDSSPARDRVEEAIVRLDRTIALLRGDSETSGPLGGAGGPSVLSKSVRDPSGRNMDDAVFGMPGVPDWGAGHFRQMQQMREMMDRMMEDQLRFFDDSPGAALPGGAMVSPSADIAEENGSYVVRVDLPGADKEKIRVEVRGRMLSITGERTEEMRQEGADGHVIRQERRVGTFRRTIPLPGPVDESKVSAKYENGVLAVTLPKAGDASGAGQTIPVN